jgi:hypothetical protein
VSRIQDAGILGIALLLLLATPVVIASQPSRGFAAYTVTETLPTGQRSALVNESLSPSGKAGFSTLVLQLTSTEQNLTYSRLVNASTSLLPYLPSLPAQPFDYSNGTRYKVQVNFSSTGTAALSLGGTKYTLSVYSITAIGFYGNRTVNLRATVETFPSALVYSVNGSMGGKGQFKALLQATDLPLVEPPPQMATTTYVGAGIGVGGLALAAGFMVRRRQHHARTQEQKPIHWVD